MATYIRGRHFTVRVGSNLSSERIIEAGVVQGSKIGPILFNVYINDIPSRRNCQTQLCLFADDTAIMSTGESINIMKHLNEYLDDLGKWLIRWKVKVNTDKCQPVYFTRKRNTPDPPPIKLFRRRINWSNYTKYLGVTLDKRLTYKDHIDNIRNKVKACRSKLYPMMGSVMEGPPPKINVFVTTFDEVVTLLNSDVLTPLICKCLLSVIPRIDSEDNDTPEMSEKARELMIRTEEARIFLKQLDDPAKFKGENFHIYCETMDDQTKLINYLNEQNLEYFVISVQTEKPIKVVIKGLPIDTTCEEIEEELKNKGYNISKVNQFRRFKTKALLPIYQVHLLKSANIAKIYEEKTLLYMRVKIEKFIRRTIGQCYKCQSFAHTSSNCKMQTKCAICAENHDSRPAQKK
ncbi:putative RNA-directed DNA polymerase like protein [Argiope bruennichi]|uniref:Putative RNA-directed DNA polymerase like protein n=1 Tax=Argiope bruennichi TaxID=94029 RepID=A0A8T0F9G4_ARGBR|nr:putative RNA-directed DNA polymerase like protein [Argiope bruennichi]